MVKDVSVVERHAQMPYTHTVCTMDTLGGFPYANTVCVCEIEKPTQLHLGGSDERPTNPVGREGPL